jgi:hypothetical protein
LREVITPAKSIAGVTVESFATMKPRLPGFESCQPGGITRLLDANDVHSSQRDAWPRSYCRGRTGDVRLLRLYGRRPPAIDAAGLR